MKTIALIGMLGVILWACSEGKQTREGTAGEDWIVLFDGKTFDGWQMYGPEPITEAWTIEEGMIVCNRDAMGRNVGFGRSLITNEEFDNFELQLEYKMSKNGNSGIMYHVVEDTLYGQDYETGPEYQLLDDSNPDHNGMGSRQTAANYDMHAPAADKKLNGPGEWNAVRLIYNKGHVEHWLNGEKVLEFEEGSDDWKARKAKSKWTDFPGWGTSDNGHISLQNHGNAVWFRNIRVKRL